MAHNTISVKEALSYGWETFKKNWQFLVVTFIIVILAGLIPQWLHDWSRENMPNLSFIFTILGWFVQMITGIGTIVISLKIVDGKKPTYDDIYKHYNLILNFFLGSLIYGVVVLVGFILLIVPGIIWGIKYQYITYLIVDKKMAPMDAFRTSGKITNGAKLQLFYLGLAFIGITILGMIVFGLGLVISWPIVMLAGAHVYRKLSPKASS